MLTRLEKMYVYPKKMICAGYPPAQDLWQARVDSVRPTFEEAAKEMGKARIDQEAHPDFWSFRNQQKTPPNTPKHPFFCCCRWMWISWFFGNKKNNNNNRKHPTFKRSMSTM